MIKFSNKLSDELHHQAKKKFVKRKVFVKDIDEIWGADLIDMNTIDKDNKDNKYLLNVIDVFSKYAWSIPIKKKDSKSVLDAFKSIIQDSKRKPQYLWVDKGSEFYNKDFKNYLKENKINMYSTFGDHKSAVIERFNRTLKNMMWKYFDANNTRNYIDVLDQLLSKYNNNVHRTIKMTPVEASNSKNKIKVFSNINDNNNEETEPKFKVGDWVRISRIKEKFEKGYDANFTREIFKIRKVKLTNPVTYLLDEYDGTPIEGGFYEPELLKTKLTDIFDVEKVIKTKTEKGKKYQYVKWLGWPDKYNSWIENK